ncbi:MAG: MFS transporter [Pseudomonadota bacterium]|nr:MFS transporter [Pseudomonadota bacterium]
MATIPHMKRNVALLSLCQGYAQTSVTVVISVSALASLLILEDKSLATLPHAFMWVATALAATPASLLMKKYGRRRGFAVGSIFGLLGCTFCTLGLYIGDFWLFVAGTSCFGAFNAFNQYLRFAAAEAADDEFRPTAISWVIGGGILAAFVGGTLAGNTANLMAPQFVATYIMLAVTPILFAITIQFIRMPEPERSVAGGKDKKSSGRPLGLIMKQPAFVVAAIGTSVSWAGMILMMAATPLSMKLCGLETDVPFVIQWHMFAMFAPSFFAGQLVSRFGNLNVVMMGFVLFFGGIVAGLTGVTLANFFLTNMLIGAGWNLMLIGSTSLLVTSHTEEEKGKVQGANDTIAYMLAAISSFFAGYLQIEIGWNAVMIAIVPQILIVAAAVYWMRSVNARTMAVK